jgi:predicted dehydrogenase
MSDRPNGSDVTRRDFLKSSTAGAAAAVAGSVLLAAPKRAVAAAPAVNPKIIGANDRIRAGVVGVKGMGGGHIRHILEQMPGANVEVAAICDVWEKAREKAKTDAKLEDSQVFDDHERMFETAKLDAVIVATPDHSHGYITRDALKAGLHAYMEKPMTLHLKEAFKVLDDSKKHNRLVALGTQACTEPKWRRAMEIVKEGHLGRLLWAQASYCRNNPNGEWNYDIDPDATEQTVDWKTWLEPAKKRPWSPERYFRWRKYWDYGSGVIGDLLPHRIAPLMMAMGVNEYPSLVSCMGGNLANTDASLCGDDEPCGPRREVADTHLVNVQFPSGVMLFLVGGTANERGVEDMIRGHKANLSLGGGKIVLDPERPYVDDIDGIDETAERPEHGHANHLRNFFEATRGNEELNTPVELATQIQTVVSMAIKSYRERKMVRFDARRRKMRT